MTDITKNCNRCKLPKSLDSFTLNKKPLANGDPSYRGTCKTCLAEQQKANRAADPERFRAANKRVYENHKERRLAEQREWRQANSEYDKARQAKYRKENPEVFRRAWHKYRVARHLADDGSVTTEFLKFLFRKEICIYCNNKIPREQRSMDHIIPISRGGLHSIENLVMCCKSCNSSKRDRLLSEWKSS